MFHRSCIGPALARRCQLLFSSLVLTNREAFLSVPLNAKRKHYSLYPVREIEKPYVALESNTNTWVV